MITSDSTPSMLTNDGSYHLSVIMPNYNHGRYIKKALEAMLEQSLRPFELIVVDDCSTDDSVAIIEQCAERDPIIRLIRNDKNVGPNIAIKRGVDLSTGDYLYLPAADDMVLPGFFEKMMAFIRERPQTKVCWSEPMIFYEETGTFNRNQMFLSKMSAYFTPDDVATLYSSGYLTGLFCANSAVMERTAYQEAGGYIPELKAYGDGFMLLALTFRYGLGYIPEVLTWQRVSTTPSYLLVVLDDKKDVRIICKRILKLLHIPPHNELLGLVKRSGVLGAFQCSIMFIAEIIITPRYWRLASWAMIRRALWRHVKTMIMRSSTSSMIFAYRRHRKWYRRMVRGYYDKAC